MVARPAPSLLTAYLEHQAELKRFFLVRTRSAPEAEDLLQDLYLKLAGAPGDDLIHQPLAYLYRLASNLMLDRMRSARRSATRDAEWRRTAHSPGGVEDLADEPPADQAVDARLRLERVAIAIEALPPRVQEVFRMHKFEGLSHAEVADRLGISRSSVEKNMIAALRHLLETVGR